MDLLGVAAQKVNQNLPNSGFIFSATDKQKPLERLGPRGLSLMESPETTYFRKKYNSLSSAWRRFTVLFGMGRSGSTLLWPPGLKPGNSE